MTVAVLDALVFDEIAELMGDSLGSFIETYLDNSPKLLSAMDEAVSAGDMDGVFHNAHQLKGGSGSIGAMQVFLISKQLEDICKDDAQAGLQSTFAKLKAAYEQVEIELRANL